MKPMRSVVASAAFIIWLSGCSGGGTSGLPPPDPGEARDHAESILRERQSKDAAFKSEEGSPIPWKDRGAFQGLSYYPIDPAFRFTVPLNRYSRPQRVRFATNTGEMRSGLRYGYFEFRLEGQVCRLQVYRLDEDAGGVPNLFVPFRDSTSGKETYASGRYLDLRENTSGIYVLDFNRAYNPYCAYNEEFSCPYPPEENTLRVAIRAGEKSYP
jgi:hypothetical protein